MSERSERSHTQAEDAIEIARDLGTRALTAVRQTPGLLVMSVLTSVVLWVFVTDAENPTRVDLFPAAVQVEAVNVDSALAVANTLPAVQIRLSATEDRWERLSSANFRAIVDLHGLEAREQGVPVRVEVTGISGVRVLETVPPAVIVNLEDFTFRDVPVATRVLGTLPRGYALVETVPDRESVRVSGPESLVALVAAAAAEVNIIGLTVGIEESARLVPVGAGGGEIRGVAVDPPVTRVSVAVEQSTLTRTLPLEVALLGDPAAGYRIADIAVSPSTVQVEGPIEVLLGLDALALATVSIAGATETVRSTVAIPVPAGLAAHSDAATVLVRIEPVPGSMVLTVIPEIAGTGEGLVARIEETVTVVLAGPLPALNALVPEDVRVTADVTGLDVGQFQLPVEATAPEGVEVRTVQPEAIFVTLESR